MAVEIPLTSAITTVDNSVPEAEFQQSSEVPSLGRRYIGISITIIAAACNSLTSLIVKILGKEYHTFTLGVWRFQGVLLPSFLILIWHTSCQSESTMFDTVWPVSKPENRKTIILLLFRAFFGCTGILLLFGALGYISVADASVIGYSTPIATTVVAYFVLHEAFSIVQIVMAVTSLIGVFIISRPPFLSGSLKFETDVLIGTGFALGYMLFYTGVLILLRYLRKTHWVLTTFVFGLWGSGQCIILALSFGVLQLPQSKNDWMLGIALALLTFLSQILITIALQYEQSSIISVVRLLDPVFGFVFQFVFLSVTPDIFSFLGGLLVILSVVVIGFRKWVLELPDKSSAAKKLWIFTK